MSPTPKQQCSSRPVIILLGGPGSGKGTHGRALAAALQYEHLSSGEHLRDHIRRGTPLGAQTRECIEKGQFVPDHLANELVHALFAGRPNANGFVLDGYPRALAQAEALEAMVPALGCAVTRALYLSISDDEIVRRLSGRLTCRACGQTSHVTSHPPARDGVCDSCGGELFRRADDNPATIRRRISVFHRMSGPLLEFYRSRLAAVSAEGPPREVSARVIEAVKRDRAR